MLDPQKTSHSSPLRARVGVSFVDICDNIDRITTAPHCIWISLSTHLLAINNAADHPTTGGVTATTAVGRKKRRETLCRQQDTCMVVLPVYNVAVMLRYPDINQHILCYPYFGTEMNGLTTKQPFLSHEIYSYVCGFSEVRCFQIGRHKGLVLYGTLYWCWNNPCVWLLYSNIHPLYSTYNITLQMTHFVLLCLLYIDTIQLTQIKNQRWKYRNRINV